MSNYSNKRRGFMDFSQKADKLAEKMNSLTERFKENLDISDEMQLTGSDLIQDIEVKVEDIEENTDEPDVAELVNLKNLLNDFKYIRETLKNNTDNGKHLLNSICADIMAKPTELDGKMTMADAEMVASFAELNKALVDNMKLFIQSYKEISTIIMNLEKIKSGVLTKNPINQTLNITNVDTSNGEIISTADLIKQLSE